MSEDAVAQVVHFIADRALSAWPPAPVAKPCLAENWWVEERLAEGLKSSFSKRTDEEGLRLTWRMARDLNVKRVFDQGKYISDGAADLLHHQLTFLTKALAEKTHQIFLTQRVAA